MPLGQHLLGPEPLHAARTVELLQPAIGVRDLRAVIVVDDFLARSHRVFQRLGVECRRPGDHREKQNPPRAPPPVHGETGESEAHRAGGGSERPVPSSKSHPPVGAAGQVETPSTISEPAGAVSVSARSPYASKILPRTLPSRTRSPGRTDASKKPPRAFVTMR